MMLLKALLARLAHGFGFSASKTLEDHRRLAESTYNKYPQLEDLVIQLLERSFNLGDKSPVVNDARQVQFAFPAMEIIQRVGIPFVRCDLITSLLIKQLESPVWNIREKAARTLSFFQSEDSMIERLQEIGHLRIASQNPLHGMLLCLHYSIDIGRLDDFGTGPRYKILSGTNFKYRTASCYTGHTTLVVGCAIQA